MNLGAPAFFQLIDMITNKEEHFKTVILGKLRDNEEPTWL